MAVASDEKNALAKRARRYARTVSATARLGVGAAVSRLSGQGAGVDPALVRSVLGGLKGPLMKVAQLAAAIPDLLPPEHAVALATLQADAPPMGPSFTRRRMAAELGPHWRKRFARFEEKPCAAASLGQVHKAAGREGEPLACKLQYPDMASTVEADLRQLKIVLALFGRFSGAVDTGAAFAEIAERLREELDYGREARAMRLYGAMLKGVDGVHVPRPVPDLSTDKLLTMTWMDGEKLTDAAAALGQSQRNAIAARMFRLWYAPFYRFGVLHGDPHAGNYTLRKDGGINLLDFGCIRAFDPDVVRAVVLLYCALRDQDEAMAVEAYRLWGFSRPTKKIVRALNLWASFIYAPFMEDRVRSIGETHSTARGRAVVAQVHAALRDAGADEKPLSVPRPFVLLDRASVGLGGLFIRLGAEANWHRLFHEVTENFCPLALARGQKDIVFPTLNDRDA